MTRRALYVSPAFTVLDGPADAGCVKLTPADTWAAGLGAFLDRVAAQLVDGGVVVLGRAAVTAFKLPDGPTSAVTEGLAAAVAAGWSHGKPQPWTLFYGDGRPTIVVGLEGWDDFARCDIVSPHPIDTVYRLRMWHELTGHPWRGSPGIAGMHLLRETLPRYPMKGAQVKPSLHAPYGPDGGYESDWTARGWSRPLTAPWAHGYDATRMYLAGAQSCESLSPWRLHRTSRSTFDRKLAGWWEVDLGPWNEDRIPAPAGPGGSGVRWVTTPTLALLEDLLHAGGAFQTFEVLDSWTAPGRRILRKWAEVVEHTYQGARRYARDPGGPFGIDQDGAAVQSASKAVYRQTIGMLKPTTGTGGPVYRADWHYTLIAHPRCLLWRKAWAVGQTEDRWPISWDVDHLWYPSDSPDPEVSRPRGLALVNVKGETDALGTFKHKGTRERRAA